MSLQDDRDHLDKVRQQVEASVAELSALLGDDRAGSESRPVVSSGLPKHVHYKIFRDYIEHEDGLINNRLLWIINIQGFLFATYGFSVQKLAEIQNPPTAPIAGRSLVGTGVVALDWLIILLPILGIFISIFSLIGVFAAQNAIAQLTCDWAEAEKEYLPGAVPSTSPLLPGIIGGGDKDRVKRSWAELNRRAHKLGFLGPIAFPWIFIVAWLLLLAVYLWFPNHIMPGRL
jgi:hypothetical protein